MPASQTDVARTASADLLRVPTADVEAPREGPLTPEQGVRAFRRALEEGEPWYPALLSVVSRWTAAEEWHDGVLLRYLIAGEAFDWLLLAQRLVTAADDLVSEEEAERLVVFGRPPHAETEEEFEAAIGPAKYRAHLNFQYGVTVEEILLLSAETEIQKAGQLARQGRPTADVEAYERVYGKPLDELKVLFQSECGYVGDHVSQAEMRGFTYWLSKYRIRNAEPARIASDTRKAMTMLARLEGARARLERLRRARKRAEVRTVAG